MSNKEEEKYFQKIEAERRERIRREQQMAALRQSERAGIREALDSNDEIADEALELGFDAQTARVLPLVPLIEVAWVDGTVTKAEEKAVLEIAVERGIAKGSDAYGFLERLLDEAPSELFFERVNRLLRKMVGMDESAWVAQTIPELAMRVAEASGGFLGLVGDKVSDAERALIEDMAAKLHVGDKTAAGLKSFGDE